MSYVTLESIVDATFRANPKYELRLFDRLAEEERQLLEGLRKDPEFYGILTPVEPGLLGIKAVCHDTALLFLTLRQPGRLPQYVLDKHGFGANASIVQLVLDGVLEVEVEQGFVSGVAASARLYGTAITSRLPAATPSGAIEALSDEALAYAEQLEVDDTMLLSARLYFYNRVPASESWRKRLPDEEAVLRFIGADQPLMASRLAKDWRLSPSAGGTSGWFPWQARAPQPLDSAEREACKLYISPQPEHLPEAFAALVEQLTAHGAHHFKVGSNAWGLLRPDKLVAYFSRREDMQETAFALRRRLDGCPAQGVPFTGSLGEDGLLSWGVDPPADKGAISWRERESWRLWLTNRLATALASAKSNPNSYLLPRHFAIERLRLDHVDTTTWTPTELFGQPQ